MQIRLVNIPAENRALALKCVEEYEKDHLHDGREAGMRHGVVWSTTVGSTYYVYHTKTSIAVNFQAEEARE